ncbi:MAG: MBL fold metallo-hydrolase [Eubacteriales bacterium]
MDYDIISTGSRGNCTILNGEIAIDMGVSWRQIQPFHKALRLVLLTHIHSDHFCRTTIRKLSRTHPLLRFGVPEYLIAPVIECGVKSTQIDVLNAGTEYRYNGFTVIPFRLRHNVPNQGYKLHFADGERVIYATDTCSMEGIEAPDYDLYLVEANYTETDLQKRIERKAESGEYAYEYEVRQNHLSEEACDAWLYEQMGSRSQYVYMHRHIEKTKEDATEHEAI